MIVSQHTYGLPDMKGINIKIKHDDAGFYTTTIIMNFVNGETHMISVVGNNLDALVPTIEVCPVCNIELHEKDLVAMGNSLPMANPDVDDYENLPF